MSMKMLESKLWILIVGFLAAFFAPLSAAIFAVCFLLLIDTFAGIWVSKKKNENFSWKKMLFPLIKGGFFTLAIITAHIVELYLLSPIPFVQITIGIIGTAELISIFRNISYITKVDFVTRIKEAIMNYKVKDVDVKKS